MLLIVLNEELQWVLEDDSPALVLVIGLTWVVDDSPVLILIVGDRSALQDAMTTNTIRNMMTRDRLDAIEPRSTSFFGFQCRQN
jgi:hypothetical protein